MPRLNLVTIIEVGDQVAEECVAKKESSVNQYVDLLTDTGLA